MSGPAQGKGITAMDIDPQITQRVVLYVEDEPVNVLLMRMLFERRPSLHLEVATTGQQALAMAPQLQPALLLLDLNLPDCHGTQLLPLLRRHPGWQDLPAVAVTAESRFQPLDGAFQEVWRKPLDLRRALARLDEMLGPSMAITAPVELAAKAA